MPREAPSCWICGDTATSREHIVKRKDLSARFGAPGQRQPLYFHSSRKTNIPIYSLDNDRLKTKKVLCHRCNTTRTQPYDRAWDMMSGYLEEYTPENNPYPSNIDLGKVFGVFGQLRAVDFHLYCVKHLGCIMRHNNTTCDLTSMANALIERRAHPSVFIALGCFKEGVIGHLGYREGSFDGQVVDAVTFIELGNISVRVWYMDYVPIPNVVRESWHPSFRHRNISINDFGPRLGA